MRKREKLHLFIHTFGITGACSHALFAPTTKDLKKSGKTDKHINHTLNNWPRSENHVDNI